jgi:hypothetical protein
MAQPSLDYQLKHAASVLLCTTAREGYTVDESLKGPTIFTPDVKMFELLGYRRVVGEKVVLIVIDSGQIVDLMPVEENRILYAPSDASVREALTLNELRDRLA